MPPSMSPPRGCSSGPAHLLKWLSWTRSRARRSLTCRLQKVWMVFTLTRHESGYTFRAGEICRLVLHTFISKRTRTTTRPSAKSPRAKAPAPLSGHPSYSAIMSPHKRLIRNRRQFWCMRPRTEKSVRGGSEIVAFNLNPPGFRPFGSKLAAQRTVQPKPVPSCSQWFLTGHCDATAAL